jgi:hypothetical protein
MYSDGFGLALLEAIACGPSAIASEVSIGPEIVTADCGFISLPGDMDLHRLVEYVAVREQCDAKRAHGGDHRFPNRKGDFVRTTMIRVMNPNLQDRI